MIDEFFPDEGPIKAVVGVFGAGTELVGSSAPAGILQALEEFKEANPDREIEIVRLDTGTDGAIVADRVGAYLNANPDTTAYFDTGLWHAYVARVMEDRGMEPGSVLMGGFDIVSEVLQAMEKGYIQVQVDQQPYMQGFMSVMQAYLAKNFGLAPTDIDTGQGLIFRGRRRRAQGTGRARCPLREKPRRPPRPGEGAAPAPRAGACVSLKAAMEKPELVGLLFLVGLVVLFQIQSDGVFLSSFNLQGILGILPEMALVAIGVTILMICGEFDLSVGSVFALMPMVMAVLMVDGVPFQLGPVRRAPRRRPASAS